MGSRGNGCRGLRCLLSPKTSCLDLPNMSVFEAVLVLVFVVASADGFNLFEFLQRKFNNDRPVYQPPPQKRVQYRRPPAPRWPQLQYNYDRPSENVIEEQYPPVAEQYPPVAEQYPPVVEQYQPVAQPQPPKASPQPPRGYNPYRPQHHEIYEPEQPADIPVVVGHFVEDRVKNFNPTTTTRRPTAPPPTQASVRFPEYEEIEIITAPPLGGHSNYKPTYEVQVGVNFNTRQ